MTDSEILRSCEGCTSQHLRLVADRLRDRVDNLRDIHRTATTAAASHDLNEIREALQDIIDESKPEGPWDGIE
jgi:hypothetical protein